MAKVALLCISLTGGGALGSIANAVELQNICNANQDCTITQSYDLIESNQNQTFNTIQFKQYKPSQYNDIHKQCHHKRNQNHYE